MTEFRHPLYLSNNKGDGQIIVVRKTDPTDLGRKKLETRPPRTTSYSVSNPVSFEEERRREGVGFPTVPFKI
jgi:hypothetical protein